MKFSLLHQLYKTWKTANPWDIDIKLMFQGKNLLVKGVAREPFTISESEGLLTIDRTSFKVGSPDLLAKIEKHIGKDYNE